VAHAPRSRLALVVAGAALALAACDPDARAPCLATYQHLVGLARANPEPEGEARFVDACVASWDPKRLECLRQAKSVADALGCKAVKKRPG